MVKIIRYKYLQKKEDDANWYKGSRNNYIGFSEGKIV